MAPRMASSSCFAVGGFRRSRAGKARFNWYSATPVGIALLFSPSDLGLMRRIDAPTAAKFSA